MWIKSQAGGLFYCLRLRPPLVYDGKFLIRNTVGLQDYDILGVYATKERALEVLEDIRAYLTFPTRDYIVFEMPLS